MQYIVLFILLLQPNFINGQTIRGNFLQAKKTEIVLKGYDGFTERVLAKTMTDEKGNFILIYPKPYQGVALLQIQNSKNIIVMLNKENFAIQWDNLQNFNTLKFTNSPENDFFAKGININQETEQKLVGLNYLLLLYKNNKPNENWLLAEINTQEQAFDKFIEKSPKDNYAKYYLSYRKFSSDLQLTNEKYKELNRVKQQEITFKKIDFASEALWHSGLLEKILSSYYQVLELYQDRDIIVSKSTDTNTVWLNALKDQPIKQQQVAEFCFTLLEKKGLTKASEHIALSMLNKDNCKLTDKQTNLFEQYRKLAIGNIAPNIVFERKEVRGEKQELKNLNNKFKLVVFGASWCPNCQTDYPALVGKYKKLKEKYDLQVVYISIDTDKQIFETYYKETPFITFCDTKGWDTPAVKDYHIFATPTYFLLDKDLKILAKMQSPEHLEAWLQTNGK